MKLKNKTMFENISWTQYLTVLVIVLVVYYLYVGVRYYGPEIKKIFGSRVQDEPEILELFSDKGSPKSVSPEDQDYEQVEQLTSALKRLLVDAADKQVPAEEILEILKSLLGQYDELADSPFRPALNELIVSECGRYGIIQINEEVVDELWND